MEGPFVKNAFNILFSLVGKSIICAKLNSNTKSIKILHKEEGVLLDDVLQYQCVRLSVCTCMCERACVLLSHNYDCVL